MARTRSQKSTSETDDTSIAHGVLAAPSDGRTSPAVPPPSTAPPTSVAPPPSVPPAIASLIPPIYENPYSLSQGDQLVAVLVSNFLQGSNNYNSWVRSITTSLVAKNKMGFILGTIPTPPLHDPHYNSWTRRNSMVMGWIINSVSPPIAASILYRDRASAMWHDLHDRYYQSNGPQIFQLKQSISNIKQGDLDITTYFTKLQTLCDELNMFGPLIDGASSNYQEQDYVLYFVMGLNESYAPIRSNILMMEPLPPINKVFSFIIEEKQRPLSNLQLPIVAPVHTHKPFGKKPLHCTHYGLQNHTCDRCYKLHGFPLVGNQNLTTPLLLGLPTNQIFNPNTNQNRE
ncbi:uncharacterized protein LOC133825658 [Humulus lupulus]|uniref:uncharacterized protein LOC133825658 n=1 Tax=Humulus lupulus TaxID=3486 RepID=UPI002B40B015|nr:uncharacterized protein LOC133825658 [Humulus lupulus]